ncbi:hypothetical protein ACFWGM_35135 [Streptomyces roseolus]|uniref:hypothetical protein n=1 Tax=Streptomyces roseolus TaxID=67358 RepID=UPI00362C35A9
MPYGDGQGRALLAGRSDHTVGAGPKTPPPAPRPRRVLGATPITVRVPLFLDAFHLLHHTTYTAYAHAHLTPRAPTAAVDATFGALAADWTYLLGKRILTAHAWAELVRNTDSRRHPLPHIPADDPLRYDALVLTELGYSSHAVAEVTGRPASTIRYLIAPHPLPTANLLPSPS